MIHITISPQTGEQIRIIAAAMIELLNTAPAEVATAGTAITSVRATFPTPGPAKTKKAPAAAAESAQAAAESAQAAAESAQAAAKSAQAAAPTLEEVRAVLKTYKDTTGKSVKALLATVDAPHLLSVLPERYAELLANMEKM